MFNFNYIRRAFRASKYGKLALIVLFVGLISAAALFAGDLRPAVSADAAGLCPMPGSEEEIRYIRDNYIGRTIGPFPTNHAVVWNKDQNCNYEVGLKVFKIMNGNQNDQVLFDQDVTVLPAGNPGPTRNLQVNLPSCQYQIDLVLFPNEPWTPAKQLRGWIQWDAPQCGTTPTLSATCDGSPSPADVGQTVTWRAHPSGGSGSYSYVWTGSDTFPDGSTGNPVATSYNSAGTKNAQVTVTSGGQSATATCSVRVDAPQPQAPTCSPSTQTVDIGENAYFTASGGNGTYAWTATGGSPASGSGSSFHASYSTSGTKTVTVRSGGRTGQCRVTVRPPTPQAPVCSPSTQTVAIGENAYFTASGGNGSYTWSAPYGSPSAGIGSSFHASYSTAGTKTVTVNSNGLTDRCTVIVQPPQVDDISCSPQDQTVDIGETASFSATGGDGAFHWTAFGGNPSSGAGQDFATTYSTSGSKTVTVNDNSGHSAQCRVQVNPIIIGAPSCAPASQSADIDETVFFTATGGNGTYTWSATGGSPSSGNGSSFNTRYSSDGTKIVTVTSNGLSDQCVVYVDQEDDDLECSPSNQDADVDEWVTFRASGGSGYYYWTADDGDPDHDTGRNFTTRFEDEGRYTVRVRDDEGRSATCHVDVNEDYSPRRPSCSPSSQTASVNERIDFYAHGGTGDYEWDARDGSPRYGYGSRFTTSFDEPGRYEIELDSNGETDTCEVRVLDDNDGAPFCSPSTQFANVNDYVTFSASGGNGTYFWSTSADGSPSTGSGSSFGTRFIASGNKFVIVSSNGRTSQCLVQIGSVLGASTVITGPTETAAAAAGLGFLGALGAYGAIYRDRSKKILSKLKRLVRR